MDTISAQCGTKFLTAYTYQNANDWLYFGIHIATFSPIYIKGMKNDQDNFIYLSYRTTNTTKQAILSWLKKNFDAVIN